SFISFGQAQSPFQTLFRRLEVLDVKEQPWTLHFEGSRTPFRGELLQVQNSFRGGLYDILKVQKSFIGRLLSVRSESNYFEIWNSNSKWTVSGTPLEVDYDISKIQTFHFEDWILFEDPGRRNTIYLLKVRGWIPRRNFEGLGLPGTLRNFEGLHLLNEDFEGLRFSLGATIFSRFDAFCWIEKVKSCLLKSNQLEQYSNH
ncbi:hypothetical protein RclHR1_25090001, partial [Rhizophagus clarus]